ncbi:MAG TPA: Do family serine endopeptidase [Candidatus Acidoferrales bacterium]|nr:Do family serine endopeptidase [Candidatus Acidoferrales bacterium]
MGVMLRAVGDWARRRKLFAALVLFLTLGLGILIGSVISGRVGANRAPTPSGAGLLSVPNPVRLSSAFATIAAQVEPAVVNISTTQVLERPQARNRSPRRPNDPFGDFFNHLWENPDQPEAEKSLGSGVIVDPKGFILTNQHVIDGATKIQVTLNGGNTKYDARLVGRDDETDLAVIKIQTGRALPTAHLGNSDGVQVGDWVLAFGSPFGLQSSVTAGIISAKQRSNIGQKQLQHFIQTDAAINPGNSGGPLVNMAGEVIGINTAIYTGGRSFEGVGFALPSTTAISVYNQLVSQGHVTRGSIGVTFQEERSENPVALRDLGAPYGMIIETVSPNSPAARAGLQPGDVVVSLNGAPVHTGDDLVNPILQTPIGQAVRIGIIRGGRRMEVPVPVADRDKLFPQQADADQPSASPGPAPTGVGAQVEELTPELAGRVGYSSQQRGVIVREVEPASIADDPMGLQRGDVIVEVNHVPVYTLRDYQRELGKLHAGQDVLFKVVRRFDQNQALTLFLAGVMPEGK